MSGVEARIERPQASAWPVTLNHPTPADLLGALRDQALWLPAVAADADIEPSLRARVALHRHGPLAGITVAGLAPADLPALKNLSPFAFVNRPADPSLDGDPVAGLRRAGMTPMLRYADEAPGAAPYRRVGSLEFLLGDFARLQGSPVFAAKGGAFDEVRYRAVALLDLVQDFEILRPLLARAAGAASRFDLRVAITERVVKSPLWPHVKEFVAVHGIDWFTPSVASEVAQALGSRKSLLLTASESTAAAHAFGHTVCLIAPPRALRVTMQHGLECIGLRHHRAHDLDFAYGVRFASDLILTWSDPSSLPDLHPGEADKCIAVGVIKATAERAAALAEQRWLEPERPPPAAGRRHLLIAENLHSVRFRAPGRYQRFLRFIRDAQRSDGVDLTIRSHPASRTLEKQREVNQLKFLDDMLRLDDLTAFDGFVSPPSTILLDAVLAGVPAAVWSDSAAAGDGVNYDGLPAVADFADWLALGASRRDELADLAWAVRSTTALNGVPAAWNTLVRLFD